MMHPGDYWIYAHTEEQEGTSIYVVADILTIGWDWPPTLSFEGKFFRFHRNEVMEPWMIGEWGGHAKYLEILPENSN